MTEESAGADEQTEEAVPRNVLVERSPLIVGAVGAVVALVSLVGLPWEMYVIANSALAWLSLGISVLALSSFARGRQNAGSIVGLVLGVIGFVFWTAAPETLAPLPAYAYILTAVVMVAAGWFVGRMNPAHKRPVYIACAGAVVFTIVTASSRLGL